jgi:hypothetical protein
MMGINGYGFGNIPNLDMQQGKKVRVYILSVGDQFEGTHTPYWYGQTIKHYNHVSGSFFFIFFN